MQVARIDSLLFLLLGLGTHSILAQEMEISGTVKSEDNVENVHVLNITSKHFTITNSDGHFKIKAKVHDTLRFSSIQHQPEEVVLTESQVASKYVEVFLESKVNELNEVVVGKIMTGDLESDMKNFTEKPPINFYDVGIPGYKGKPKTQQERRLNEATTGGGIVALNPIINAITGRTKRLKEYIRLERRDDLLYGIISRLSDDFLSIYPLEEDGEMDFFYFCSDDPDFESRCRGKTDMEIFEYLVEKYEIYQNNLQTKN